MKTVAWPLARLDFMYHQNMLEIACTLIIVSQAQSSSTVTQGVDESKLDRQKESISTRKVPNSRKLSGKLIWDK